MRCMHEVTEVRAHAQMALEAINSYKMPEGQELSAVSLSWGLDEQRTGRAEMELTDKWLSALLEKACQPFLTTCYGSDP